MPVDLSIYQNIQPVQMPNVAERLMKIQNMGQQAAQNRLALQEGQIKLAEAQKHAKERDAIESVFRTAKSDDELDAGLSKVGTAGAQLAYKLKELRSGISANNAQQHAAVLLANQRQLESDSQDALKVYTSPEEQKPAIYAQLRARHPDWPEQIQPGFIETVTLQKDINEHLLKKAQEKASGLTAQREQATLDEKGQPKAFGGPWVNDKGEHVQTVILPDGKIEARVLGQAGAAPTNAAPTTTRTAKGVMQWNPQTKAYDIKVGDLPPAAAQSGTAPDDPRLIAQGIIEGRQPPVMTGLYRNAAAVRAELERNKYDLAAAQRDWTAVQKHLSTLNGAQQERLRQAISFTAESLPQLEEAYQRWKKLAGVSGVKIFNRTALASSKQLPGEAGSAATNLEALIADMTSELGTVYKGGNSSTDESLSLAAKNLSADWNEQTFNDAVKRLKTSLKIRANSITSSQPAGISTGSPYNPQAPAGGGQSGGGTTPVSSGAWTIKRVEPK